MIKTHKDTYVLLKTPNSKHMFYKKGTHKGTYVLLKTPKNEQMFYKRHQKANICSIKDTKKRTDVL